MKGLFSSPRFKTYSRIVVLAMVISVLSPVSLGSFPNFQIFTVPVLLVTTVVILFLFFIQIFIVIDHMSPPQVIGQQSLETLRKELIGYSFILVIICPFIFFSLLDLGLNILAMPVHELPPLLTDKILLAEHERLQAVEARKEFLAFYKQFLVPLPSIFCSMPLSKLVLLNDLEIKAFLKSLIPPLEELASSTPKVTLLRERIPLSQLHYTAIKQTFTLDAIHSMQFIIPDAYLIQLVGCTEFVPRESLVHLVSSYTPRDELDAFWDQRFRVYLDVEGGFDASLSSIQIIIGSTFVVTIVGIAIYLLHP